MAIRALTKDHDWQWGQNKNSYVQEEKEIAENLETRILSFLNDCFWATDEGIDWWHLLDYNQQDKLEYAVQEVISNTPGVTAINSVDAIMGAHRKLSVQYNINTIYSQNYTGEVITPSGSISAPVSSTTPTVAPTVAPVATPVVTISGLVNCTCNYSSGDVLDGNVTITANDGCFFGNDSYHYLIGDYFYNFEKSETVLTIDTSKIEHNITILPITADRYGTVQYSGLVDCTCSYEDGERISDKTLTITANSGYSFEQTFNYYIDGVQYTFELSDDFMTLTGTLPTLKTANVTFSNIVAINSITLWNRNNWGDLEWA